MCKFVSVSIQFVSSLTSLCHLISFKLFSMLFLVYTPHTAVRHVEFHASPDHSKVIQIQLLVLHLLGGLMGAVSLQHPYLTWCSMFKFCLSPKNVSVCESEE